MNITDLWRSMRYAPLFVLALAFYAILPSRFIFREDYATIALQSTWHPAFTNIGDYLLFGALFITWSVRKPRLNPNTLAFLLVTLVIVLLSLLVGTPDPNLNALGDGLVIWLRFAATFLCVVWLTELLGTQAVESLAALIFLLLCVSALAAYSIQFGQFNRIYAGGMTVASFSQMAVVTLFIALVRRTYLLLAIGLPFLVLTFSFTSIGLFLGLSFVYIFTSRALSARQRTTAIILVLAVMAAGIYLTWASGQFGAVYSYMIGSSDQTASLFTLHGRTPVWSYGLQLISSGAIGPLGAGFGRSPLFLNQVSFLMTEAGVDAPGTYSLMHFHSLILELVVGMGLLSLVIFFILSRRVIQTWRTRCQPAGLILLFFLLSQSVDFTLYQPKEVVFWAMILGLAEGEWWLHHRAISTGRAPLTQRVPAPTPSAGAPETVGVERMSHTALDPHLGSDK